MNRMMLCIELPSNMSFRYLKTVLSDASAMLDAIEAGEKELVSQGARFLFHSMFIAECKDVCRREIRAWKSIAEFAEFGGGSPIEYTKYQSVLDARAIFADDKYKDTTLSEYLGNEFQSDKAPDITEEEREKLEAFREFLIREGYLR